MKTLYKNLFYQTLFQMLNLLLPVFTIPIVSRALGAENIGVWRFTNSIVSYVLLIAAIGGANYAVREIAYVKNDKEKLSEKFWELQLFNMIFSLTTFLLFLLFVVMTNQNPLFLIQSLMILGVMFDIAWFFQGIEEFRKIALLRLGIKIISFSCIVIFINAPEDLWLYVSILSSSQLLSTIILWTLVFRHIERRKVTTQSVLSHFKPALNFFLLKISATIFTNVNATVLGFFSTMIAVGYFSNGLKLIVIPGTLLGSINQVLLPKMASFHQQGHNEKMIRSLQKSIHFQLYLTIAIMFGIIAINNHLIVWFLGEDFYFVKHLIPLLAPIIIFKQLHQSIADQYLVPKNEMRLYNLTMIIGTVLNVTISLALIPFIDIYGAVFGFLLGQIFLGVSRAIVLIKKSTFRFDWLKIAKWLFSGFVMLLCITITTQHMRATVITTIVQILIVIAIYSGITMIFKENPILQLLKQK